MSRSWVQTSRTQEENIAKVVGATAIEDFLVVTFRPISGPNIAPLYRAASAKWWKLYVM